MNYLFFQRSLVCMPQIFKLIWFTALINILPLYADDFTSEIDEMSCRSTSSLIKIDGELTESAWKDVQPYTKFFECRNPSDLGPKRVSNQQIAFRFLVDEENLYIGAEVQDKDLVCNPESLHRTKDSLFLDGDVFEVFLQPEESETTYYEFHVNPLNANWDARYIARNGYMPWTEPASWQSGMKSAVQIKGTVNVIDSDKGWTIELAIPLKAITNAKGEQASVSTGKKWRFSICLYDYQIGYDDANNSSTLKYFSSSKMPVINYHNRGYYNFLNFE
jgi:hypothetical protein